MPLSPEDVKKVTKEDEELISKIESQIDNHLKENFDSGSISVPLNLPEGLKLKIKNKISSNYKNVGWKQAYFESAHRDSKFFLSEYLAENNFWDR